MMKFLFSLILVMNSILAFGSQPATFIQGPTLIESTLTTATAAGTTTLTVASVTNQQFTGTTTQTVVLPDATTLKVGRKFVVSNRSTGVVTVKYNDTTTAQAISAGNQVIFLLEANGTTNGVWDISYVQSVIITGNLTDVGTDGIAITGGTGAVIGSGTSIAQQVATGSQNGYLLSTDWTTFNGKQAAGNYIIALTGDVTAAGPGSAAATLATVNANVGSFTNSSITVNAKGLITAASSAATTGTGSTVLATAPTMTNPIVGTQASSDNSTKAASTAYVQTALAQLNPAAAVYAASTANIAGTYTNAVSGICIGDTFTTTATTNFALDGTSPAIGARVLFKDQTSSFQDGVWTLTTQAVGGVSGAVLTRALDFDSSPDINAGSIVPVVNGTINAGSSWYQTATVTTCNSDSQTWTQFQKASSAYLLSANNLSDVATKATAFNNISPMTTGGDIIYGGTSGAGTRLANGSSGQVLQSNGGTSAPSWINNPAGVTNNYYSGYSSGATWSTTSATFVDPTVSGTNTLTQRVGNGITVTTAASNLPGITFTPASNTAIYQITATSTLYITSGGNNAESQLTDGTTVISTASAFVTSSTTSAATMTGIYAPGTTSAVTVKIRLATPSAGTPAELGLTTIAKPIEWTIVRLF